MNISILGLGLIGGIWARNLHSDGFSVKTWNRTPKDFPGYCSTPAAAIEGASFIIIVVSDPAAVASVVDQIVPALKPGQFVLQSSTLSEKWTKALAARVQVTGASFLEAPFTGSKPAAEQRKNVFYLGGDPALIEQARPVLAKLGQTILRTGPLGSASALKLAMNLNLAQICQALSESLAFARHAGISDDIFFEALHANVGRSGLSDLKEPKLRARDYAPQFSVKHMGKDLRLALESAPESLMPQTAAMLKRYETALTAGWGDDDFCSLIRQLDSPAA